MKIFGSILSQKNLVVRRTTRPQFLVFLTYFLVAEDARTLEFCYPDVANGLVTNYVEGRATKREGGHVKFCPYEKGGRKKF